MVNINGWNKADDYVGIYTTNSTGSRTAYRIQKSLILFDVSGSKFYEENDRYGGHFGSASLVTGDIESGYTQIPLGSSDFLPESSAPFSEELHRRMDPSAYPTAKVSRWEERAMQVTSARWPVSCHIANCLESSYDASVTRLNSPFDPSSCPIPRHPPVLVHTRSCRHNGSLRRSCTQVQKPAWMSEETSRRLHASHLCRTVSQIALHHDIDRREHKASSATSRSPSARIFLRNEFEV